jgi:hypothetical protein
LFNTTARYAATNEVATLSNGSIAGMRIVNANRSPNAVIIFQLPFHISITEGASDKLPALRSALDKYARDHPNHWKCFMFCRVSELQIELEKAILVIGFQSRCSWQDAGRILFAKADLICHVYDLSKSLGVSYDELPKRQLLYYAGVLKDGRGHDYRQGLHHPDNIRSHADDQKSGASESIKGFSNDMFLAQLKQSQE